MLHEKVRRKLPKNFDEAKQWARVKDRKLQFQANLERREPKPLIRTSAAGAS